MGHVLVVGNASVMLDGTAVMCGGGSLGILLFQAPRQAVYVAKTLALKVLLLSQHLLLFCFLFLLF